MKKDEIKNNCLIAEFMGGKLNSFFYQFPEPIGWKEEWDEEGEFLGGGADTCWDTDELEYNEKIEWLFPVLVKIKSDLTGLDNIGIVGCTLMKKKMEMAILSLDIDLMYKFCIDFIEWKNSELKTLPQLCK